MKIAVIVLIIGLILLGAWGVLRLTNNFGGRVNLPFIVVNPTPTPTETTPTPTGQQQSKNIEEIISEKDNLNLFSGALEAAELDEQLKIGGPYTVFAPNDRAAINVLEAEIRNNTNQATLKSVINNHIIIGKYTSNDLLNKQTLETIGGQTLVLELSKANGLTVDGINIIEPDIEASNGIIHVIDSVLLFRR